MTQATATMFQSLIGRQVETKSGVMLINDVLTHKTGVLKSGDKAPYLHLIAEMGDMPEVDLHPQKALELMNKGESGAYKILGALAAEASAPAVAEAIAEAVEGDRTPAELVADLSVPAVAVAAAALGMTVEQVAEGVAAAGEQGAAAAEKKESKKAGTVRIYAEMTAQGKARKDIIARMRTELGLSVPGANTYYQNVKSGLWK